MQTSSDHADPIGRVGTEHGQHETPDRVRRERGVVAQRRPGVVAGHHLVDAVRLDQRAERCVVEVQLAERRGEADEGGVRGGTPVRTVELVFERVERAHPVTGQLVARVVDHPGDAVDGEEVAPDGTRQGPGCDREVLLRRTLAQDGVVEPHRPPP